MGQIDKRLADLGITLPEAAKPVANYVPWVRTGNLVFISGQGPIEGGKVQYPGALGKDVSLEDGIKSARLCAINVLAQLKEALGGDLDRVVRVVKLLGFVNATAGLQAASPAFETARMFQLVGAGVDAVQGMAWILVFAAGLALHLDAQRALAHRLYDVWAAGLEA